MSMGFFSLTVTAHTALMKDLAEYTLPPKRQFKWIGSQCVQPITSAIL